jgi:hypothetical protein
MDRWNPLAGFAIAALVLAAPPAWGQLNRPGLTNGTTSIAPSATSPIVPGDTAAPGAPGSGVTAPKSATESAHSQAGDLLNSNYVHKKIDQAQAEGRDVSAARIQEAMGNDALRKGMDEQAADHFKTALRAVGQMPDSKSPGAPLQPVPGAVD